MITPDQDWEYKKRHGTAGYKLRSELALTSTLEFDTAFASEITAYYNTLFPNNPAKMIKTMRRRLKDYFGPLFFRVLMEFDDPKPFGAAPLAKRISFVVQQVTRGVIEP